MSRRRPAAGRSPLRSGLLAGLLVAAGVGPLPVTPWPGPFAPLPGHARAALPAPDRVLGAVAQRNRESGRGQGLRLEVALFIAATPQDPTAGAPPADATPAPGAAPLATGTLWSHPDGRVGLELRATAGFVERHVLRGRELVASRDGTPLQSPRPFLPPFPVFQPRSSGGLAQALRALGADPERVALGYEGAADCYVLGGREGGAALWIDQLSLDPMRLDRGDGVQWRLGPSQQVGDPGELVLPAWIDVAAPGLPPARLEVRGGAPAGTFPALDRAWLGAAGAAPGVR